MNLTADLSESSESALSAVDIARRRDGSRRISDHDGDVGGRVTLSTMADVSTDGPAAAAAAAVYRRQ